MRNVGEVGGEIQEQRTFLERDWLDNASPRRCMNQRAGWSERVYGIFGERVF